MKHSTLKRIQGKIQKLPVYFVDSSIFLEVLFNQSFYEECLAFFNNVHYHYRLMTSTLVLGEVIKSLNDTKDRDRKLNGSLLLFSLLEKTEIKIVPVSSECITNTTAILSIDSYIESSDRIIFSSAITENCKAFVTLDSDFSARLGHEFNILVKKPFEA